MAKTVIEKDVIVHFLNSKGEMYGEDRFMIKAKPGDNIDKLVEERAKESRWADPSGNYTLDIHYQELAA